MVTSTNINKIEQSPSHLESLNTIKTMTYDIRNLGSDLRQSQTGIGWSCVLFFLPIGKSTLKSGPPIKF